MTNANTPIIRNGWTIYRHSLFDVYFHRLVEAAKKRRAKDPVEYLTHPETKLLAHLQKAMYLDVPQNPAGPQYQATSSVRGWSRVKLPGRHRLFFRFDTTRKVIIFCWLNSSDTLRKAGASTDPYTVFSKMVMSGNPPTDFQELLKEVLQGTTKPST